MVEVVETRKREIKTLGDRYKVERLMLFGSALRDDFDPENSDLDFCVEFSNMSPEEHAAAYFGLLEDLQELFGRRVDLLEIETVRNPYLRRAIEGSWKPSMPQRSREAYLWDIIDSCQAIQEFV